MEQTILRNMNLIRKISIISAIISTSILFGFASWMDKDSLSSEEILLDPRIYVMLVCLFVVPVTVAGIIASFFKLAKNKIIVWSIITGVTWLGIITLAVMGLNDSTIFGVSEI